MFKPEELTDGPLTLLSILASSYEDEHLEGDVVLFDHALASHEYENDGLNCTRPNQPMKTYSRCQANASSQTLRGCSARPAA